MAESKENCGHWSRFRNLVKCLSLQELLHICLVLHLGVIACDRMTKVCIDKRRLQILIAIIIIFFFFVIV